MLPKGRHPWLYISLEIAPDKVDVNVHPTKREVHFLNEDDIVESICVHLQRCLVGANQSRTFQFSQLLLPGASEPERGKSGTQKSNPRHSVRTDADTQTLDAHVVRVEQEDVGPSKRRRPSSSDEEGDASDNGVAGARVSATLPPAMGTQSRSRSNRIKESECSLRSIAELRAEISTQKHRGVCAREGYSILVL